MKKINLILAVLLVNGIAATALVTNGIAATALVTAVADNSQPIADVQKSIDSFSLTTLKNVHNVSLRVKGPDGLYVQVDNPENGGSLHVKSADLTDGVYHYEYSASSNIVKKPSYKDSLNNGRDNSNLSSHVQYEPINQSGYFVVKNGQMVTDDIEEPRYKGEDQ